MDWIELGARVLLAAVFMTAAVGKLADRTGAQRALEGFGVPRRWTGGFARLLPLAELAAALALMFRASARWGAAAALILLTAFVVGIATAMSRGEAPDCHCFGQIHSAPAGWRTLSRNLVLGLVAVLVVAHGPGSRIGGSISAGSSADLVAAAAAAAIIALAAVATQLWVTNRDLRRDLTRDQEALAAFPAGLPVGSRAPRFELSSIDGRKVALDDLLARGRPIAIAFISPSCVSCRTMLPDLARWQKTLADRITIAPVAVGTASGIRELAEEYGLEEVLMQRDAEVFQMYRAAATPSVVMVTADGRIGSRIRSSHAVVEAAIRHELRTGSSPSSETLPTEANGDGLHVLQSTGTEGVVS
jgi:uncharacterized membrane protein YphA (DoxX/SURF4 family)/thiol-disulfide isomerase/thioredoxin